MIGLDSLFGLVDGLGLGLGFGWCGRWVSISVLWFGVDSSCSVLFRFLMW